MFAPPYVWHAGTRNVFEALAAIMGSLQRTRFLSNGGSRTMILRTSNGSRGRRLSRTAGSLNSMSEVVGRVSARRRPPTSDARRADDEERRPWSAAQQTYM